MTEHNEQHHLTQVPGWDPKLQTVESRRILVDYALKHGIKPAMRYFNCSRNTVRKWLRRFNEQGEAGLKGLPRGRKPKQPRIQAEPQKPAAHAWPVPEVEIDSSYWYPHSDEQQIANHEQKSPTHYKSY